mmetsp:Transcript_44324/g.141081  ORF Transcript_44324/g.141081 Transcript_44324/m.141081 type:complete len:208 (-) Transcript_44324:609-1232(-)
MRAHPSGGGIPTRQIPRRARERHRRALGRCRQARGDRDCHGPPCCRATVRADSGSQRAVPPAWRGSRSRARMGGAGGRARCPVPSRRGMRVRVLGGVGHSGRGHTQVLLRQHPGAVRGGHPRVHRLHHPRGGPRGREAADAGKGTRPESLLPRPGGAGAASARGTGGGRGRARGGHSGGLLDLPPLAPPASRHRPPDHVQRQSPRWR